MKRYIGTRNNRIRCASDSEIINPDLEVLEIPSELDSFSLKDIMFNFKVKDGKFIRNGEKKLAKELKVAFVSNWKMQCGISTYAEYMAAELAPFLGDIKLFIENNNNPTGPLNMLGNKLLPQDKIVECWKRGEAPIKLIEEIKSYDPDIVLINHEFGLWSNARHWLSLLTQLSDYRTIIIMHSVFPYHQDKSIYESGMPEIIVHLQGAKDNLINDKKITAPIHLIPHGCYPIVNQGKLWDNYKSENTFIQQGFGFKYKNFEDSIRAAAILKKKYHNVFFTAMISESPFNKVAHQIYHDELIDLIKELDVQENVAIIRGFQSDNIIDTCLRSNQVAVFPYLSVKGHEVFGSSGAARLAMAAGVPVISSNIPHFSDMPTIKIETPEQMAKELDKLFSNRELKIEQIKKQNNFIQENSWANIAKQYVAIFEL